MYAMFSDDRRYLLTFNMPDQEEPEVLTLDEFISIYGEDALPEIKEPQVGDIISEKSIPNPADILYYYAAFRRFVESCGEFIRVSKLKEGIMNNSSDALEVAKTYYGDKIPGKLQEDIEKKMILRSISGHNLNTWMRKVGFKPLSFTEDVRQKNDIGVSDVDCLIRLFSNKKIRERTYRRIDKYTKKVELRSPLEILKEVKRSFKGETPEEFRKPSS